MVPPSAIRHQPLAISHDIPVPPPAPVYSSPASMHPRRYLPALFLLFVGSGCAALIYEIVWFQLLQLVIGSSAISLGILLGTFMGGMCLGSIALAPVVSSGRHPLRVYAVIEVGIGLCGIAVLAGSLRPAPALTGSEGSPVHEDQARGRKD